VNKRYKTLSDRARVFFRGMFLPIALFLNRLGVHPNVITLSGLIGHIIAAVLVVQGQMFWAGVLLLVMAPFDFLDGMMARESGEASVFGAFLDSVTDRYSELVIMGGFLFYYLYQNNLTACVLVYLAAAGSLLVSYIRGRAEALGFECKVGILSRMERYFVLIPGLILNIPIIALWIIAILANFTALQRIYHVWQQARAQQKAQV
jgi:CDP-diacylglycerol---glycerol-3-phosphate 3-phosphatidyltransferase